MGGNTHHQTVFYSKIKELFTVLGGDALSTYQLDDVMFIAVRVSWATQMSILLNNNILSCACHF